MHDQRIALDVMGGDNAPQATLRGALRVCSEAQPAPLAPERLLLVGDEERIRAGLLELGADQEFDVLHASQVVEMTDAPAAALRNKRDSSIARAVGAVGQGAAGALVSMGNTGALVAAATRGLGTLSGVKRPGIAVTMDLGGHRITVLDMGVQSMAAIVAGRVTDIWDVTTGMTVLGGMCIAVVVLIGLGAPAVRRL